MEVASPFSKWPVSGGEQKVSILAEPQEDCQTLKALLQRICD